MFVSARLETRVANECEVLDVHEQICGHSTRSAVDGELADHEPCCGRHEVECTSESIGSDRCTTNGNADQPWDDAMKNDPRCELIVCGDSNEIAEILVVLILISRLIESTSFQDDIEMIHRSARQVPLICL